MFLIIRTRADAERAARAKIAKAQKLGWATQNECNLSCRLLYLAG